MEKKMTCVVEQNGICLLIDEGVLTWAELCSEDIFDTEAPVELPENLDALDTSELMQLQMKLLREREQLEKKLAETRRELSPPSILKRIGGRVFANCWGRKSLMLPEGLEEPAEPEPAPENILTIPAGVTAIGAGALKGRGFWPLDAVILPEGLEEIGDEAFAGMDFGRLVLPSTLKRIGKRAFFDCHGLKEVLLPWGLEAIDEGAFFRCGLEEITIPGSVREVGRAAFAGCKLSRLTVKEGVKYLWAGAFAENPDLEAICLPESLITLEREAFGGWLDEEEMVIQADEKLLKWLTGSQ